jgi:hypothetical protein
MMNAGNKQFIIHHSQFTIKEVSDQAKVYAVITVTGQQPAVVNLILVT